MKVIVLYHYLYPDDVVSAIHLTDLCTGLSECGWHVTAMPCQRARHYGNESYPRRENWRGVTFERVWRPRLPQGRVWGRVLNTLWMQAAWACRAVTARTRPDAVIVGTDPVLSVVAALVWKLRFRDVVVIHWCFDLYPDAAVAEGLLGQRSAVTRLLQRVAGWAYRHCEAIADLGSCMRHRLARYGADKRCTTVTPWALEEPPCPLLAEPMEREVLFGGAQLGLLYSGNLGRAHSFSEVLGLARLLRDVGVGVAFSARGIGRDTLEQSLTEEDANVRLVGFAAGDQLEKRLGAADVHLVSLRAEWTGAVVPSKFFGALAVGRPVLFVGPDDSAIAGWIREYEVGWVLNKDNLPEIARVMQKLAADPSLLEPLFERCHEVYQQHFSRKRNVQKWHQLLLDHCQVDRLTSSLDLGTFHPDTNSYNGMFRLQALRNFRHWVRTR